MTEERALELIELNIKAARNSCTEVACNYPFCDHDCDNCPANEGFNHVEPDWGFVEALKVARDALKNSKSKRPVSYMNDSYDTPCIDYKCPTCGSSNLGDYGCGDCGQKIDWSKNDDVKNSIFTNLCLECRFRQECKEKNFRCTNAQEIIDKLYRGEV